MVAHPGVNYGRAVMPMSSPSSDPTPSRDNENRLLRFGVFEVDLAARELRKNDRRIRLQEQPFQVLVALLENAGKIVTREDLRQKIWPADTFVDFDHSLNTAVNKIRESLGDSASSPRFVETLARRGYRFIAPVDGALSPFPASAPPALRRRRQMTLCCLERLRTRSRSTPNCTSRFRAAVWCADCLGLFS